MDHSREHPRDRRGDGCGCLDLDVRASSATSRPRHDRRRTFTCPGPDSADGQVGGSLAGIRHRVYVGGVVTNTPENLIQWLVSPQKFSPRSAMPATGITEAEARDVAAFLYSR